MAYLLCGVTIRTDNSKTGMSKISELWQDIFSGKIPMNFADGKSEGLFPVSVYSGYESDEKGAYDLTVKGASRDFLCELENKVSAGTHVKIQADGNSIPDCTEKAWRKVWTDEKLNRAFKCDYETSVPSEFSDDKKAHCVLYISVK